jgi:hypothetical protein
MKNILIPTDFNIKSLKLINKAVERFQSEELNIILVHALEPDHSISGLLMLNKRLDVHQLYTNEFVSACEVLRNKYASVVRKIKIEFYYGSTKAYRNNFLSARGIDAILFAEDYELNPPSAASQNQLKLWATCDCPVFYEKIQFKREHAPLEESSISELLHA